LGTVPLGDFPHEIDGEILERNRLAENRFQERFFGGALLWFSGVTEAGWEAIL